MKARMCTKRAAGPRAKRADQDNETMGTDPQSRHVLRRHSHHREARRRRIGGKATSETALLLALRKQDDIMPTHGRGGDASLWPRAAFPDAAKRNLS